MAGRLLTLTASVLLGAATSARAEPDRILATTYLREGPGTRYRPTDEALTGQAVGVIGCSDAWCRIRIGDRTGWVARTAIGPADLTGAPSPGPSACVVVPESGYHGSRKVRYCGPEPTRP